MIVTMTIKIQPTKGEPGIDAQQYMEFRRVLEETNRRGGFGIPITLRWMLDNQPQE